MAVKIAESLARLLVIEIAELLPIGVLHDETGLQLLDSPGRREAAQSFRA